MGNAAEKLEHPPQAYANELVELNRVEKAMAELRAKHGTVPDYGTKEGYQSGKASLRELTKYRTGTDKARLAITKPHRDFIEQVNQYAKGLIGEIEQLEAPHREAKQEEDERAERERQARIAKLQDRLDKEIGSYRDTAQGLDAAGLADLHDAAQGIDTEGYYDLTKEAEDAKAVLLQELRSMHESAMERERLAAEQAELEEQRRKLREEEARRAAEQAELEELRRFKAEQEAAKAQPEAPTPERESKPIDTSRLTEAAQRYRVPVEDQADVSELITGHEQGLTRWDEAMEDLMAAGFDAAVAHQVLNAIAAGEIRHVAFNQGDA
ncbi:hypothetical protein [Litchfieldella xinjiangensis]|uniref:hypothetical protein n=1 Tax=Litchfieldella xinjiangensis TaxID=1166948 RepID=UPI0005BA981B|nr:hypothetical protein [Halomonas xinjiangensis]